MMLRHDLKVSIITVTYNAVSTIEQTILSVLHQSYKNIEYIIVDGESTDGTCDVISKYKAFISCFISEPDDGIYDAMNKGIMHATGDIIGIINSDDWYEPDAVKEIISCFNRTGAELVYGNIRYIFSNKEARYSTRVPLNQIWYTMAVPHPSVFIRHDIYQKYGLYNKKYRISADYELLLRFYIQGVRFEYIDALIANFRDGGISTVNRVKCAKESRGIRLFYVDNHPQKEVLLEKIETKYKEAIFNDRVQKNPSVICDLLEQRFPYIKEKGIVVFGAGARGKQFVCMLKEAGIPIVSVVDNDRNRWNTEIEDILIKSPEALKNFEGYIVVAVRDTAQEICQQLSRMNNARMQWVTLVEVRDEVIKGEADAFE